MAASPAGFIDRDRTDGGGHVAAIAGIIDNGALDADLGERVVHVGVFTARRPDDADFRQRGHAAAHAVELTPIRVGRPSRKSMRLRSLFMV
jgi:hypothetical protein